ncbi:MAG: tetratricopeptide repeat protein [Acidobacteriia bacterium]|nr:tetratricopeptide repeat protein [Terriglobia bacterium]
MKRAASIFVVLAVASLAAGQQQTPANQSQPASQPKSAQGAAPAQGKRPPQAKTQAEFAAYNVAIGSANDPAAMEKAADDFAAKFPDSELRVLLYKAAMRGYQNANNGDQMSAMAESVLKLDADDPMALIGAAEVLVERTRDSDLDKDQRWSRAQKYAQHALETVDPDTVFPAGTTQEQMDAYKNLLRSSAYSILGALALNQDKYSDAEGYFHKSIDVYPSQPDPVVVLRLAIALDKQERYPDALKEANRAVELTQDGTVAGKLARQERDRLVQLTGGIPPASQPPAGTTQNTTPPPH